MRSHRLADAQHTATNLHTVSDAPATGGERSATLRTRRRRRRLRLVVAAVLVVAFAVPAWSFTRTVVLRSNGDPFSAKATEWARDHGLSWVVDHTESFWYSRHQPRVGGVPKGGIPRVAAAGRAAPVRHRSALPVRPVCPAGIVPIAAAPLPGEGVWQRAGRPNGDVCFAYLRPDAIHTSVIAGVAWMDMHHLAATLHNGTSVPGSGPWRAGPSIAVSDYRHVVAAFNGGFRLDASRGGYYTEGRTVRPLVAGRASLVIYSDGRVHVGMWGRDDASGPAVASVRQNLDLLVDHGQPVAGLNDANSKQWGTTLGNKIYTWRSGVGVDAKGNLVYVGGPGLNVGTLAAILQRAGCVRAMELDINPEWVSLMVYSGSSPQTITATKLLTDMQRPADRYLQSGSRDFVELDATHR
ncbi:MAG: hypothetical protein JWL83_621 [Actinomycetia bacterium]|nr:hypothetical protein [Actinomycetes bacterium]